MLDKRLAPLRSAVAELVRARSACSTARRRERRWHDGQENLVLDAKTVSQFAALQVDRRRLDSDFDRCVAQCHEVFRDHERRWLQRRRRKTVYRNVVTLPTDHGPVDFRRSYHLCPLDDGTITEAGLRWTSIQLQADYWPVVFEIVLGSFKEIKEYWEEPYTEPPGTSPRGRLNRYLTRVLTGQQIDNYLERGHPSLHPGYVPCSPASGSR